MKGSFTKMLVWFTWTYWGRLMEFLKLMKYLQVPRRWYEIRDWHSRECKYLRLASLRFLLNELVSQEWVTEEVKGSYVLSDVGRSNLNEFINTVKYLLVDFEPPKSRSAYLTLLVKGSWFETPRTVKDVSAKLGLSKSYVNRLLKGLVEESVLKRRRVGRKYVYER